MAGYANTPHEVRSLTALRGVAATWVVIYHFAKHFSSNLEAVTLVSNGFLAVDLFFYLSGFIIFLVYFDNFEEGNFKFSEFMKKRFARLYPVHFITLLLVAGLLAFSAVIGIRPLPDTFDAYHFGANVLMVHGWGLTDSLNLNYPSWSISAEMFAYALFPLIAWFVHRYRLWLVGVVAFITLIMMSIIARDFIGRPLVQLTYDFSIIRILPEFFIGGWTYLIVRNLSRLSRTTAMLSFAASAAACLVMFSVWEASVFMTLIFPILIAGLYLIDRDYVEQQESNRDFIQEFFYNSIYYLGKISYSLYMVHALFEMACFSIIEKIFGYPSNSVPLYWLFPVMALTFVGAAILYEMIEKPGRKLTLSVLLPKKARKPVRQA